ncbi:MAG TPA: ABC transporter permease [Eubacteriaceae bacterium]|nr:ABC transporter permease [Eubacteriaceae bacterium]
MAEIFKEAIKLLATFDKEIYEIVFLSMIVSFSSTFISTIIAVPLGILLGNIEFPFKRVVVRILYTTMSLPPVIVGLVVFLILSRKGPLGYLDLNFTPSAMIIAQTILIIPIIMGIVYNRTKEDGRNIHNIGKTLGASYFQRGILTIKELRIPIFIAIVSGYGRAVSEVGAIMIVGGNIKGHTRVMTTSIAMLKNMGNYSMAIAIGIVLLTISFIVNGILYHFQGE